MLTTCCICLSQMKEPIRTLPCLHSSCASCINQLIMLGYPDFFRFFFRLGEKPFKCPQCRSPFDAPSTSTSSTSAPFASLEANYFTARLLASPPIGSTPQDDFDPNNIKCGFCEENEAEEYCKDCPMFYCAGCKRGHRKPKANNHHQFVSLEEGLKIHRRGSASSGSLSPSSSSIRITRCHTHPQQEVNSYCEICEVACCSECAIDHHPGHMVVRDYDRSLSQAIKETAKVLGALKGQGRLTEERVHQVFNQLRLLLDEREAKLIADIEQEMHRREKELVIQKDDLEFLMKGIRDSVEFGECLVREGKEVEIVASRKSVIGRFQTLGNEVERISLIPVTDEVIEFLGGDSLVDETKEVIKDLGAIFVKGEISAEKSRVVRNSGNGNDVILLSHHSLFDLVLNDQKGNPLNGMVPLDALEVKIEGPSKDVKVDLVELAGDKVRKGGSSGSLKLSEVGDHEISILFRGRHFQGSPFKLQAIDKPVYRREYGLIGESLQPIVRFGSQGSVDGQFSSPSGVACNLKGEIVVADRDNHRIQVFDKNGRFLFKFGSKGNGNGQFQHPYGVTVDHRNQNQIVVADGSNHRIQIFDERGGFLRSFGSRGNGDGQFSGPTGIAVDQSNGDYLVVDRGNQPIHIFDSNGQFIRKFGSHGNGNGQFRNPCAIGLLSNGNLVVCDSGNHRLQILDSSGNFIRVMTAELNQPDNLFIDSDDNILVVERKGDRVYVLEGNGDEDLQTIGEGLLSTPSGVCVDMEGKVIVADGEKHQIFIL